MTAVQFKVTTRGYAKKLVHDEESSYKEERCAIVKTIKERMNGRTFFPQMIMVRIVEFRILCFELVGRFVYFHCTGCVVELL